MESAPTNCVLACVTASLRGSVPESNLRARLLLPVMPPISLALMLLSFLGHVAEDLLHRAYEAEDGGGLRGLDRIAVRVH